MKTGDVVRLKAGGPLMTVERIGEDTLKMVTCIWFTADNTYQRAFFPTDTLEELSPEAKQARA